MHENESAPSANWGHLVTKRDATVWLCKTTDYSKSENGRLALRLLIGGAEMPLHSYNRDDLVLGLIACAQRQGHTPNAVLRKVLNAEFELDDSNWSAVYNALTHGEGAEADLNWFFQFFLRGGPTE